MKIFIASPLFNPQQLLIINRIELLCKANGHDYFSAREHSPATLLSPEDRKIPAKWKLIYDLNVEGLRSSNLMISVLEYALPSDTKMYLETNPEGVGSGLPRTISRKELALPDTGTVWEMGYFNALGKPVIGFHSTKDKAEANLMLCHSCDTLISGWEDLEAQFEHNFQLGSNSLEVQQREELA